MKTFIESTNKQINIKILFCYLYPNILISNHKPDLKYLSYHHPEYQSYNELYSLVTNSTIYDTLASKQLDTTIYYLTHEDKLYTREIQKLIDDLLEKRGIQRRDIYYLENLDN